MLAKNAAMLNHNDSFENDHHSGHNEGVLGNELKELEDMDSGNNSFHDNH